MGDVERVAALTVARRSRLKPDVSPGIRVEHQRPGAGGIAMVAVDPGLQHKEPTPLAIDSHEEPMGFGRVTELVG